ncbi:hypothetical protein P171DRAFT_496437 [Karstenula rhodostoma CBS 690.94]|uniref:Uncharacterized protein n=1 Tax=Karstenula rhodostoma CBS 690.94 TaxID=1392251 RepID=A0A9P4PGW0_9PLEO|nr:hypothetical protein P171DRAFT_496437 [Karstenula rhodostoma CBS 690.94]
MASQASQAPSGNRKRQASAVEPEGLKTHPGDHHVTGRGGKRARTDAYNPTYTQITPIDSKKRRAASQDPDEGCDESVDEYQIIQRYKTEQIATQKSAKQARKDVGLDSTPSAQNDNVDQVSGEHVDQDDYESDTEENPAPENQEETQPQEEDSYGSEGDEEEEDDDDRYIPANPPTQAFFVQPPAKDLSWTKGRYAPTLPYVNQMVCPVNWVYVKSRAPGLTDVHIQAYMYRKPWVANGGEVEYDTIVNMFHAAGDNSVNSLEGVRKRFGKANLAVFETTGVWFESSTPGLKDYGIKGRTAAELQQNRADKNDADDADADTYVEDDTIPDPENPLPVKEELRPGDNLITFILQPPDLDIHDRCLECCQSGLCYDEKCREAWLDFCNSSDADSGSDSDDSDVENGDGVDENGPYCIGTHSKHRWVKVLSSQRAPFGCPIHQPLTLRFVHYDKFEAVCESPVEPVYLVDVPPKVFSLFTSCFAPEFRGEFPEKPQRLYVYLNEEDAANGKEFSKAVYEDIGSYTVGDILEAYCCSQSLNCPVVSDVLLGHLRNIVKEETSLKIFQPCDLQYVFHYTNASDPIRLLLFDAFRLNMAEGKRMTRQYGHLYPSQLVRYWNHWERQQNAEISPETTKLIENFLTEGWQGNRGASNGLRGHIRVIPESDEHPDDQEGVIWGNCIFKRWSRQMGKLLPDWLSREALHERFTQSDSLDALSSNNDRLFWDTYRNRPEDVE